MLTRKRQLPKVLFPILGILFIVTAAHAAPLYNPGDTLDPSCSPTNPDCTVSTVKNPGPSFTATSTSGGGFLFGTNGNIDIGTPRLSAGNIYASGTLFAADGAFTDLSVTNPLTLGELTFTNATATQLVLTGGNVSPGGNFQGNGVYAGNLADPTQLGGDSAQNQMFDTVTRTFPNNLTYYDELDVYANELYGKNLPNNSFTAIEADGLTDPSATTTLSQLKGIAGIANNQGGGDVNDIWSVVASAHNSGSANVSTTYGMISIAGNYGSGTVGTSTGLFIEDPKNDGTLGPTTENYGIYVQNQAVPGATNYALYTAGGNVDFENSTTTINGILGVGSGFSWSSDPAINVTRDLTPGTGGDGNAHAFEDYTTFNRGSGTTAYASFNAVPTLAGTRDYDHFKSFQAYPVVNITGTLGYLANFDSQPTITAGTSTILEHYNVGDFLGSGTVTTQYGFRVGALTKGASNWAFYSEGATPSMFTGDVGIGGSFTPASELDVRGTNGIVGAKQFSMNAAGATAGAANMYAPAAYSLGFGTNSVQRMKIDSSGNFSLGTHGKTTILYIGTGDGCQAQIYATSNTAPTYQATSTSLCN